MAKAKLPISRAKTAYGLLSEVCKLITEEPLRYNQHIWIDFASKESLSVEQAFPVSQYPSCGTVGCVAGWVATLKRSRGLTDFNTASKARRVLGLSANQERELFDSWAAGVWATQTVEHARAGVAHIRKFQKKYRHQLLAKKV